MKSTILGAFVVGQAILLLVAGVATLWLSSDLTTGLIWLVGEEHALGPENVIRLDNGGKLLTNPAAMLRWTLPFWFLGVIQIAAAFTLVWLLLRRRLRRPTA